MHFRNGGEGEWWIGSADLMHRNLDRRVEVLLQVCDEQAHRMLENAFAQAMADDVRCWELGPDATWTRREGRDYQAGLMELAVTHANGAA
jgi:polyphosphate kinase